MIQLITKSHNLRQVVTYDRKSFMTLAAGVTFIKINMTDLGICTANQQILPEPTRA
jgi:hypothetical protein